jgi:5-methyltetrahydrofolate--homocysteine methyltransferase
VEHKADAIGMSGLLVKSTLVMKENLEVMNERHLKTPVILGGAALTKRSVENDHRPIYNGLVYYANDAFDGLRFMETIAGGIKEPGHPKAKNVVVDTEALTGSEAKIALALAQDDAEPRVEIDSPASKSNVGSAERIPLPPFWGSRVVSDIPLDEVFQYINDAALIRGQWRVIRGTMSEEEYRKVLEDQVYPEFLELKAKVKRESLLMPSVAYGYFPCQSDGNDLIVYHPPVNIEGVEPKNLKEWQRLSFPRQTKDRKLCIADFFAPVRSGIIDVLACHVVTVGERASEYARKLYAANQYKDYLYFHGLGVETAEALAELWHKRIRQELGIADKDARDVKRLFSQGYQGSRYSFGYPACPRLEDQVKLFDMLKPERIGVFLTEEFQMEPEQSTSAIIVHHPAARYFTIN